MAYTYEAIYSMARWHGLPNNWVQCQGIRLESNIAIAIVQDIAKALKEAGKPDGSIAFFRDGRDQPTYTYPSIYEIVARIGTPFVKKSPVEGREPSASLAAPNMISNTVYLALTQLDADISHWRDVHGRTRGVLLDRGYVSVDDEVPKLTLIGRQAMETYQDSKTTYPDLATASQAELLDAAAIIGLKPTASVGRALKFIETTVTKHSFEEIEAMAWRVQVSVRLGRTKSEAMKKRRVLAAIMNAGKLAQAM